MNKISNLRIFAVPVSLVFYAMLKNVALNLLNTVYLHGLFLAPLTHTLFISMIALHNAELFLINWLCMFHLHCYCSQKAMRSLWK